MKNKRQEEILHIISNNDVETQEALLELLLAAGYKTTQATISRDIRELKLVKRMSPQGVYRYEMSSRQDSILPKFNSALAESIVRVETGGNIVVIHTLAGMAQAVAACLDTAQMEDILGCVAGDDTILAVTSDNHTALTLSEKLRTMLRSL